MDVDSIKDPNNPHSLVNITPSSVSEKILAIPDDVLLLTEEKLEHHARVEDNERLLRAAFQLELDRATRTNTKMELSAIYRGIVTHKYFLSYVVGNSFKLAYMIKPFSDHKAEMEDLLRRGFDTWRLIMKKSPINSKGEIDYKLVALQTSITKDLLDRTGKSAPRQLEINQKSLTITKDITEQPKVENIEQIEQRLKELEAKEIQQITYKDVSNDREEV